MGLFSNLTKSWSKSSRLQELQKKIAPPNQNINDVVANARAASSGAVSPQDRALEEFLDLCESDEGVKQVMQIEHLSRSDLKDLYVRLLAAGLGQWVKGHYVALSTIAYPEPLQFATRAPKMGVTWSGIVVNLLDYWEDRIPQGGLLSQIR